MKTPLKKYMKINTLKILLNCSQIPLPAPAELALGLTVYTRGPARVRELSKIQHQTESFSFTGKGLKDFQKSMTFSIFNEASVHQIKFYLPEILFQTLGNTGIMFPNASARVTQAEFKARVSPSLTSSSLLRQLCFRTCQTAVIMKRHSQACL